MAKKYSEWREIDVATVDGWELVCFFNHYSYEAEVSAALRRRIQNLTWKRQDGYGFPGYTPVQGWDWSGIRDSSAEAKGEMAGEIRSVLLDWYDMPTIRVRKVEYVF